jgi:hypothetical protein
MIRINVSGLAAKETLEKVKEVGGNQVEARIVADIIGVREVAQGTADYFFGACATGGGGAISMAIAVLGYANCCTVSTPGRPPREVEVRDAVRSGKKAFGFTCDHAGAAVTLLMEAILATRRNDNQ